MLRNILVSLIALFAIAQLVPYGRNHAAPAPGTPAAWDSPRTQELARRACFDCHSHETRWPWYASVAPFSWRVQHHVDEGREKLNFSAFNPGGEEAGEAAESVREGKMPMWEYLLAHPEARLSPAEKAELERGLAATFGEGEGERGEHAAVPGGGVKVAAAGAERADDGRSREHAERREGDKDDD